MVPPRLWHVGRLLDTFGSVALVVLREAGDDVTLPDLFRIMDYQGYAEAHRAWNGEDWQRKQVDPRTRELIAQVEARRVREGY